MSLARFMGKNRKVRVRGMDIVEYDSEKDVDQNTGKAVIRVSATVFGGNKNSYNTDFLARASIDRGADAPHMPEIPAELRRAPRRHITGIAAVAAAAVLAVVATVGIFKGRKDRNDEFSPKPGIAENFRDDFGLIPNLTPAWNSPGRLVENGHEDMVSVFEESFGRSVAHYRSAIEGGSVYIRNRVTSELITYLHDALLSAQDQNTKVRIYSTARNAFGNDAEIRDSFFEIFERFADAEV